MKVHHTQFRVTSVTSNSKESTLDLDSHGDTFVLGINTIIIQDHVCPFNVLSYDPALGDCTYQTVSSVIGYDHPITGQTYHLGIYQAISIPHQEHHILCPMQSHMNDVTINKNSKPTNNTHSIIVTGPYDQAQ